MLHPFNVNTIFLLQSYHQINSVSHGIPIQIDKLLFCGCDICSQKIYSSSRPRWQKLTTNRAMSLMGFLIKYCFSLSTAPSDQHCNLSRDSHTNCQTVISRVRHVRGEDIYFFSPELADTAVLIHFGRHLAVKAHQHRDHRNSMIYYR